MQCFFFFFGMETTAPYLYFWRRNMMFSLHNCWMMHFRAFRSSIFIWLHYCIEGRCIFCSWFDDIFGDILLPLLILPSFSPFPMRVSAAFIPLSSFSVHFFWKMEITFRHAMSWNYLSLACQNLVQTKKYRCGKQHSFNESQQNIFKGLFLYTSSTSMP